MTEFSADTCVASITQITCLTSSTSAYHMLVKQQQFWIWQIQFNTHVQIHGVTHVWIPLHDLSRIRRRCSTSGQTGSGSDSHSLTHVPNKVMNNIPMLPSMFVLISGIGVLHDIKLFWIGLVTLSKYDMSYDKPLCRLVLRCCLCNAVLTAQLLCNSQWPETRDIIGTGDVDDWTNMCATTNDLSVGHHWNMKYWLLEHMLCGNQWLKHGITLARNIAMLGTHVVIWSIFGTRTTVGTQHINEWKQSIAGTRAVV